MLLPLLTTRFIARNVVASSRLVLSRAPALQITRTSSVTRVAWASSVATKPKPKTSTKNTTAKKATTKKSTTKKTATKKTATKPAKKKPAKKATKKKPPAKKTSIRKPSRKVKPKPKKTNVIPRVPRESRPPKRPGWAFSLYYKRYRQDLGPQEGETTLQANARIIKGAAASWNALSEQEKQPFRDEANAAAEEYKKSFTEYVKNTDPSLLRRINKLRSRRGIKKTNFKSHRPTFHGYLLFFQEERPKFQSGDHKRNLGITKEIGNKWSALSDAEKAAYNERAKALKS